MGTAPIGLAFLAGEAETVVFASGRVAVGAAPIGLDSPAGGAETVVFASGVEMVSTRMSRMEMRASPYILGVTLVIAWLGSPQHRKKLLSSWTFVRSFVALLTFSLEL